MPQHTITLQLPTRRGIRRTSIRLWRLASWQGVRSPGRRWGLRLVSLVVAVVLVFGVAMPLLEHLWQKSAYGLSSADAAVVAKPSAAMARNLVHNQAQQTYNFNADFSPQADTTTDKVAFGGAKVRATFHDDPSKGATVTDPYNQAKLTITPKFRALAGKQVKNQVEYPIGTGSGSLVYTAEASGVKEDLLLRHYAGDSLRFEYTLGLGGQYAARLQPDGSVGIFGSSLPLNGNVSTGSARDAELLAKARQHAPKDKLLFTLPAPLIHETGGHHSAAGARFSLDGDTLAITATHMKHASFPLSIDPTVSVTSVSDFFRNTNNEGNADFDATNDQVTRGGLTGGGSGSWTSTTTLGQARFLNGAAAYNGYVYVMGGSAAASTTNIAGNSSNMVEYASIGTGSPATLGSWASANNSGLPAGGLSRFQLIAYNGYLYAIGGSSVDTTCGTLNTLVYYATIQVNGVLSAWSPTTAPATGRCSFAAAAANNRIYIAGGKTGTAAAGTTDVSTATINPDGTLTWANGSPNNPLLPAARYGADMQAYNGYLYLVGGNLNGTLTNTTLYVALNATGGIYSSSWQSTNNFTTARENFGATFTNVNNGYIYLTGGCSSVNGSQTCATPQSDAQVAQINADGSLGQWYATTSLGAARTGSTFVTWRGTFYGVGGCAAMDSSSIFCTTALATSQYSAVTSVGQVSSKQTAGNSLPATLFASGVAVYNGYVYVVGGCIANACVTSGTANTTYYSKLGADGTPGAWSTSAFTINGTTGVAAPALVVANGVLFAMGGFLTGSSTGTNTVWSATPTATGNISANWAVVTSRTLAAGAHSLSALYYNGYIYTFGGCTSTNTTTFNCNAYTTTVARAQVSGTGLSASFSTTSLTQLTASTVNRPNAGMGIAFYDGYIYLCGGSNANATGAGGPQTDKCNYNTMNSSGTITNSWAITTGSFNQTITRGAASASNGYLYVYGGYNGQTSSLVGDINIGKIDPSTGDIASFSLSGTSLTAKWGIGTAFHNGFIYALGGCSAGAQPSSCSTRTSGVEYVKVYNASNEGTRAVVTNANNLNTSETGVTATVYNGYVYTAGGCNNYQFGNQKCPGATDNESAYAPINPDGSLGAFTAGPNLPAGQFFGRMEAVNGNLYFMGGANGANTGANNTVYKSVIGANGVPAAWDSGVQANLPNAEYGLSSAVYNGVIYLTGGINGNSYATTVWHSTINGSGNITAWTADTAFTTGRGYHGTVIAGGYLFVLGGVTGSSQLSDAQSIKLTPSGGTTGSWSYTRDLPQGMGQFGAVAGNGYIYITEGSNGTASSANCLSNTYIAPVNANGTLGEWSTGMGTPPTAYTGGAATYYNGYTYFIGGNACANGTGSNTVYVIGQQSQAIRGTYSRYMDLAANATPGKLLVNGTNFALSSTDIDFWRLRYQSGLNNGTGTYLWGNPTTVNPITLGTYSSAPSVVSTTGTNNGVSQWWFMMFDMDQASTFTFTDDTQPAITDYTFYYAPGVGARLRNGGIFQDQNKQSLDAHP